jgi:hypothetical protein
MELNEHSVSAHRQLLTDPSKFGLSFKPISEYFQPAEKATAKHLLFEQFVNEIEVPLQKVFFYIIMDELYATSIGKADDGCAGYKLSIVK